MFRPLILSCLMMLSAVTAAAQVTVTDVTGKTVKLSHPAERFVLSEGRYVMALGLLRPENPVKGLVGMMTPIGLGDQDLEDQVFSQFPEARKIPFFGGRDAGSVSAEKILSLNPEVAIFGIQDHGPGSDNHELISQLKAAGIPVVFIDFRMDPLHNTVRSVRALGQIFGRQAEAERYIAFYEKHLDNIRSRVAEAKTKPTVFLQAHPGRFPCCIAMADGMLGPFIELAGGTNIADKLAPGPTSEHTEEFLLTEDPDIWIGTASGSRQDYDQGKDFVATGPGMTEELAQKSLQRYLDQPAFQALTAVKTGNAHSIWHMFYNSPLNIVAVDAFASWIHPELFPRLDPEQTMQEIFTDFLPFRLNGVYTATMAKP